MITVAEVAQVGILVSARGRGPSMYVIVGSKLSIPPGALT